VFVITPKPAEKPKPAEGEEEDDQPPVDEEEEGQELKPVL
jgi:hypothetical protein